MADGSAQEPDVAGRRFSDQEVALVLQRATEIEERRPSLAPGRGLSLHELHEIAREVGLSPDVIDEAVMAMQSGRSRRTGSMLGPPLSTKLVRAIPAPLHNSDMHRLVHAIDEAVDATGTVSEALGTVRWTSTDRGRGLERSTQVSFTVQGDETQMQVVERHPARLRLILHLLPASWGAMIAGAIAASAAVGPLSGIGLALGGTGLGLGIGRAVWHAIAARRGRHAQALADTLAASATRRVD